MNLKKGTENYRKARAKCPMGGIVNDPELGIVGRIGPGNPAGGFTLKALNVQTEEAKTAHWKRIDRRRIGWWGVISKKIQPLYEDEAKAIEKAIRGKEPSRLLAAANSAIDAGRPEWEKVLTAVSAALIEDFGNEIADDLDQEKSQKIFGMTDDELRNAPIREVVCPKCGGEKLDIDGNGFVCVSCGEKFTPEYKWVFDPMSAAARAWIVKNGTKSIVTILATNLDDVKRVILAGVDENLTTVQIGRNIRQFYTDRSAFKSMRIARTETSHAAGYGQQEAARQSGVVKTKTWITSRDDRVRDSHVALEGETVAFDKPYSDGSTYPGEQDIMCRCVEAYGTR